MDNFDLKKYLAEGRLFKENYVDPEDGKPFAVDVDFGSYTDDLFDGTFEKLPNSDIEKTYVRFQPLYYNEEEDEYIDVGDTDDGRYDKIDNLDFWGIWDPDTMKASNPQDKDDGFDEYEPGNNRTYYFDSEEEISDFGEIYKLELERAKDKNK